MRGFIVFQLIISDKIWHYDYIQVIFQSNRWTVVMISEWNSWCIELIYKMLTCECYRYFNCIPTTKFQNRKCNLGGNSHILHLYTKFQNHKFNLGGRFFTLVHYVYIWNIKNCYNVKFYSLPCNSTEYDNQTTKHTQTLDQSYSYLVCNLYKCYTIVQNYDRNVCAMMLIWERIHWSYIRKQEHNWKNICC